MNDIMTICTKIYEIEHKMFRLQNDIRNAVRDEDIKPKTRAKLSKFADGKLENTIHAFNEAYIAFKELEEE